MHSSQSVKSEIDQATLTMDRERDERLAARLTEMDRERKERLAARMTEKAPTPFEGARRRIVPLTSVVFENTPFGSS
jgi:hypothetical protein